MARFFKSRKDSAPGESLYDLISPRFDSLYSTHGVIGIEPGSNPAAFPHSGNATLGKNLLDDLGIPFHATRIPKKKSSKFYTASDITPEIMKRFCGWELFNDDLPPFCLQSYKAIIKEDYRPLDLDVTTVRPSFRQRPQMRLQTLDERIRKQVNFFLNLKGHAPKRQVGLEDESIRLIYALSDHFNHSKLCIPREWKQIEEPKFYCLPPAYKRLLDEAQSSRKFTIKTVGLLNKLFKQCSLLENGNHLVSASPVDQCAYCESGRLAAEKQSMAPKHSIDANLEMVTSSTEQCSVCSSKVAEGEVLRILLEYPIDGERKTALENAKDAQVRLAELNQPLEYQAARRDVAMKLSCSIYRDVVHWADEKVIAQDDVATTAGSILINDQPEKPGRQTAMILRRWLDSPRLSTAESEMTVERKVGNLLSDIIVNDTLDTHSNRSLRIPHLLRVAAMDPRPDLVSQLNNSAVRPLAGLCPVLFGGECKTYSNANSRTPAQLACSLHSALVLLVLMYLDTRQTVSDPLPPWLFLYGVIYTEKGVIIRAHYPSYQLVGEGAANGGKAGWVFRSVVVTKLFSNALCSPNHVLRLRLFTAFLIMRGHTFFLQAQMEKWARAFDTDATDPTALSSFLAALGQSFDSSPKPPKIKDVD